MNKEKVIFGSIIIGAIAICSCLSIIKTDKVSQNVPIKENQIKQVEGTFTGETDKVIEEMTELEETTEKKYIVVENSRYIPISGKYFFLFDDTILLPLEARTWIEYDFKDSKTTTNASAFYLPEENDKEWTQNFTIKNVNIENKNCFEFTEKLVNSIIANVNAQAQIDNKELDNDTLMFTYVKKDADNTLMYWELKQPDVPKEIQFVRCFVSQFSKKLYLVTYTLKEDDKISKNKITEKDIISNLQKINSVQELKVKENKN